MNRASGFETLDYDRVANPGEAMELLGDLFRQADAAVAGDLHKCRRLTVATLVTTPGSSCR